MAEYIVNINEDVLGEFDFIAVESLTKGTPLIRCRKCKYYEGNGHFCDYDRYAIDNGYCYCAEREEE